MLNDNTPQISKGLKYLLYFNQIDSKHVSKTQTEQKSFLMSNCSKEKLFFTPNLPIQVIKPKLELESLKLQTTGNR